MQFAKMIVLAMGSITSGYTVSENDICPFADVPAGTPSNPLYPDHYVAVAARTGLTMGYPDNTFRPYNQITRWQVITMVVRAGEPWLEDPPPGWQGALNYSNPTHGANLRKAEFNGLLDGLTGLSLSWDGSKNASRGECAQLLWALTQRAD